MSGYVDAGYVVGLGTLAAYGASLVARERAARRRLPAPEAGGVTEAPPGDVPVPASAAAAPTWPDPTDGA